jgi:hypothetical protein
MTYARSSALAEKLATSGKRGFLKKVSKDLVINLGDQIAVPNNLEKTAYAVL